MCGTVGRKYFTIDEEIISRGPIIQGIQVAGTDHKNLDSFTNSYMSDRKRVWEKLCAIFQQSEAWTYYKAGKKYRDGRISFQLIYNHYLGPQHVGHMANKSEKILGTATYSGEKISWKFEKYATNQKEQNNILEGLVEHGYVGVDNETKVRYLMEGIKDTSLNAVKSQILASAYLHRDFPACVTLCKDFVKSTANVNGNVQIAAVGGGGVYGNGNIHVEDRWYKGQECKDLG